MRRGAGRVSETGESAGPVSEPPLAARSLLFVPGSRPDMIAKVPRWSPDVTVVDLEDAVPQDQKDEARHAAVAAIGALAAGTGLVVLVRVNRPGSPWYPADIAAAAGSAAAGVVVPKLEHGTQVVEARRLLAEYGRAGPIVIAGLETARGVADCRDLLATGVTAAYFGAEDYIADLGGRRTTGNSEVLYARSQVMLAARLSGVTAIDQAVVAVRDDERFLADALEGRALGYDGKICVHPRQVELAHQVFTPSAGEIEHARAVLAAGQAGVGVVDGEMVDEVHLQMAAAVLRRAGERDAP